MMVAVSISEKRQISTGLHDKISQKTVVFKEFILIYHNMSLNCVTCFVELSGRFLKVLYTHTYTYIHTHTFLYLEVSDTYPCLLETFTILGTIRAVFNCNSYRNSVRCLGFSIKLPHTPAINEQKSLQTPTNLAPLF